MFWRRSVADQVDEELDFHLAMVTRELRLPSWMLKIMCSGTIASNMISARLNARLPMRIFPIVLRRGSHRAPNATTA